MSERPAEWAKATVVAEQLHDKLQSRWNVLDVTVGRDADGTVFLMVHLTKYGWRPFPEERGGFPVRLLITGASNSTGRVSRV